MNLEVAQQLQSVRASNKIRSSSVFTKRTTFNEIGVAQLLQSVLPSQQ